MSNKIISSYLSDSCINCDVSSFCSVIQSKYLCCFWDKNFSRPSASAGKKLYISILGIISQNTFDVVAQRKGSAVFIPEQFFSASVGYELGNISEDHVAAGFQVVLCRQHYFSLEPPGKHKRFHLLARWQFFFSVHIFSRKWRREHSFVCGQVYQTESCLWFDNFRQKAKFFDDNFIMNLKIQFPHKSLTRVENYFTRLYFIRLAFSWETWNRNTSINLSKKLECDRNFLNTF